MAGLRLPALAFVLTLTASAMPIPREDEANLPSYASSPLPDTPTNFYEIDVSEPVTEEAFKCLRAANLRYVIVRCYRSLGDPDPNCPATVAAAWAGGMEHVDVYFFPDFAKGGAAAQINESFAFTEKNNVKFGTFWLDVEGAGTYWGGSAADNQAFFLDLVDAAEVLRIQLGVYASYYQWRSIFGDSFEVAKELPLWYPHYDNLPAFSDFKGFGGWTTPAMKQFNDNGALCNTVGYDLNWYP